jgi:hypothetical protein
MSIYTYDDDSNRIDIVNYEDKELEELPDEVYRRSIAIQGANYYKDSVQKIVYDKIYFEMYTSSQKMTYEMNVSALSSEYDLDISTDNLVAYIKSQGYTNTEENSDALNTSFVINKKEIGVQVEM